MPGIAILTHEGHVNRHENAEDELQPPNLFLDAVDLCHVCSAET